MTVIGPDLGVADAYGTAVCVMGLDGLDWLSAQAYYEGLILTHDGWRLMPDGLRRLIEACPESSGRF